MSSCSRCFVSPGSQWVRWGRTGSRRWWSPGSPVCWPPSFGWLEIMTANQHSVTQRAQEDFWDAYTGLTCEDFIESGFDVGRVQRWCLHKHEAFLLWVSPCGESKEGKDHRTTNTDITEEQSVSWVQKLIQRSFDIMTDLQRLGPRLWGQSWGSPGPSCFPPALPRCEGRRARTAPSTTALCSHKSGAC